MYLRKDMDFKWAIKDIWKGVNMKLMHSPAWELDNWCPDKNRLGERAEIAKKLYELAIERYDDLDKDLVDLK
jgi:hypothetical protein